MADSLFRKGTGTFLVQLVQVAAQAGVIIVVTRATGAGGQGVFILFASLISLSTTGANFGVSWAGIHLLRHKRADFASMPSTLFTTSLASGAITNACLVAAYLTLHGSVFRGAGVEVLVVAVAVVPMVHAGGALSWIMLGLNRPREFAILNAAEIVTALLIQLLLAGFGYLTPATALLAWAGGAAFGVLLGLQMVTHLVPIRVHIDFVSLRELVAFGMRGYIANLTMFLNYRLDTVIVAALLGTTQLGIYSVAFGLSETLWYLPNAISTVLFPHISGSTREAATRTMPIVSRLTLLVTVLCAVALALGARWLILVVFSSSMLPALPALWSLLPGVVALSFTRVISSYLAGIGKPIYSTVIGVTTLPLTILLDLVLIPRFGIVGAAVASSVVYIVAMMMSVGFFARESGRPASEVLVLRLSDLQALVQAAASIYAVAPNDSGSTDR